MKLALLTTDSREHYRTYGEPVPSFGTAPAALLLGFEQIPELEIHVISCSHQRMKSPEKLAPNVWYHGLVVPKLGWMRTLYRGCVSAVRAKLREIRPDIVHGQGTERDCAISAVLSGFPSVLTIHGNMRAIARINGVRPFSFGWLAARLESFAIRRTLGVVCITSYTQRQVNDLARRTWIVPNAVDPSFFEVKPAANPADVLCVANILSYKNQTELIRALDPVAAKYPFRLVFLGGVRSDNPYGAEFIELVKSRPWCVHAGFADRAALKSHLAAAKLLVLPSLEDNCPMAILEAMAAGVPVAASAIGGIPDLVVPEKTGLLFDPRSRQSIQASIERLLREPELARQFGSAGRAEAHARFDPAVIARRHLDIYREVLNTDS